MSLGLRGTGNTHLREQTALSRLAADSSLQGEKQQEFEFMEFKGLVCNVWRRNKDIEWSHFVLPPSPEFARELQWSVDCFIFLEDAGVHLGCEAPCQVTTAAALEI